MKPAFFFFVALSASVCAVPLPRNVSDDELVIRHRALVRRGDQGSGKGPEAEMDQDKRRETLANKARQAKYHALSPDEKRALNLTKNKSRNEKRANDLAVRRAANEQAQAPRLRRILPRPPGPWAYLHQVTDPTMQPVAQPNVQQHHVVHRPVAVRPDPLQRTQSVQGSSSQPAIDDSDDSDVNLDLHL